MSLPVPQLKKNKKGEIMTLEPMNPTVPPRFDEGLDINLGSPQLATHLLHLTEQMRFLIGRRRENGVYSTLTYRVTIPGSLGIITQCFAGHYYLYPFGQNVPEYFDIYGESLTLEGNLQVLMTISVNHIYPSTMGYSNKEGRAKQCCYIWINNRPYTMMGINYPQNLPNNHKLTDVLGILIAEQIRFNTLDTILAAFPETNDLAAVQLYETLFLNFKRDFYNDWRNNWPEMQNADQLQQDIQLRLIQERIRVKVQERQDFVENHNQQQQTAIYRELAAQYRNQVIASRQLRQTEFRNFYNDKTRQPIITKKPVITNKKNIELEPVNYKQLRLHLVRYGDYQYQAIVEKLVKKKDDPKKEQK